MINPNGCRWCGIEKRGHARQYKPPVGWHKWEQPTQEQIKARMVARRPPEPPEDGPRCQCPLQD